MNLRTRGVTGIWRGPQLSHTVRTGCRRGRGCAADSLREPHDAAESWGSRSGAGRIRSAAGAPRNCAYMVARRSKPAPSGGSPTAAICGRPHMNLRTGRVTRTWRGPQLSHTVRAGCRRGKSRAAQLAESAREGAPQIVCGSRMTPRKAGAPAAEQCLDERRRCALPQQFLGDPLVCNAPVGLRESLRNPQTVQPSLIDFAGYGGMPGRGHRVPGRRSGEPSHGRHAGRGTGYLAAGCFDHLSPPAGQAQLGVQESHPGSVAVGLAPQGLLVGEASQPSQMAPIGAGQVCPIEPGQLFGNGAGDGRFQRIGTDSNPSLQGGRDWSGARHRA